MERLEIQSAGVAEADPSVGRVDALADQVTLSRPAGEPATGGPSIWRRVRRDVVLLASGSLGVVLAQLVFRSILIAALLPVDYGRLSLILSIYNTVWIIGASGLPNSVARYIALAGPADDSGIVRSGIRAGFWPTLIATVVIAAASGLILGSPLACLFAVFGLPSLVYSLLTMGILRGRGHVGAAASVMPIAALGEVTPLVLLYLSGLGVTLMSAFGVFCLGNVIGLGAGVCLVVRSSRKRSGKPMPAAIVPSARKLLGFSMWLAAATVGVSSLPLIIRSAAAINGYTLVAITDVALVLLSIPQRLGAVLVQAVVPHATRAREQGDTSLTISRREHIWLLIPFALGAALIAFTPTVGWVFGLIGRPEYGASAKYLAMALLAGPVRILYGLVEGVLIAEGEGRFLALTALSITGAGSIVIFAAAALGSTVAAFAVFVASYWLIYIVAYRRCVTAVRSRAPAAAA